MADDSYFTDARRADDRALKFEPYRGHRIREHVGQELGRGRWYRYSIEGHGGERTDWLPTAVGAREEVDRCLDDRCLDALVWPGCRAGERIEKDPFARFER